MSLLRKQHSTEQITISAIRDHLFALTPMDLKTGMIMTSFCFTATKASVGQGCFVVFKHEDHLPMGKGEALDADNAPVKVVVQAPSHVSLSRLKTYQRRFRNSLKRKRERQINPEGDLHVSLTETITNTPLLGT